MQSIAKLLDKAKQKNGLASDYKLALVMGISHGSLISYRSKKTLPDSRVISKICALTGDDPALLAVQIEAERAKTPEAKQLWFSIAQRLQMGFSDVKFALVLALFSVAAMAGPAWFAAYSGAATGEKFVYYVKLFVRYCARYVTYVLRSNVNLCKAGRYVPRNAHPAAFLPA